MPKMSFGFDDKALTLMVDRSNREHNAKHAKSILLLVFIALPSIESGFTYRI